MRDTEEERTGIVPVAGAVSMRTDMSNAVEERTGSTAVAEVAS